MTYIHPLAAGVDRSTDLIGGKAHGLLVLLRLGLPVPPGFVIDTHACRAFLLSGRLPEDLDAELATAVRSLEAATGRRFGGRERPLAVSVRSGAAVSMPGMMNTVLNLGLTNDATAGLAAETGDPAFAQEARRRFLTSFATASGAATDGTDDAMSHLRAAVRVVLSSWNTPRATTYRELHDIPHDLGTAVIVQAMVFGNRDRRSGTGVAFSRDPNTGEKEPYGDVLFGRQGEDVVSGQSTTRPLTELAHRAPTVWGALRAALHRLEQHYGDACHVEFTFEAGHLWLLQVRPGGLTGRAAIRVAVDLADEHLIDRRTALRRVSPQHLRLAHTPRIRLGDGFEVFTHGRSASPGVATGRIAVTADRAVRMATDGPVILVRPTTSPLDMHGLAAATGIVTSRGGPTSHAAIVARALGKPAVVDATALTVDTVAGSVRAGERVLDEGTIITLDGASGAIVIGSPGTVTATPHRMRLYPDVPATLERLRERGLPMAVVTDSLGTAESLRYRYEQIGLGGYFEYLAVAGELGCTKPDPAIYRAASDVLAVPPQQTCYVDDQAEMIVAATRLGYHGLVLSRDGAPPRPDLSCISALHDILELVGGT